MYFKIFKHSRWVALVLVVVINRKDYIPLKIDVSYTLPKLSVQVSPTAQANAYKIFQAYFCNYPCPENGYQQIASYPAKEIKCAK